MDDNLRELAEFSPLTNWVRLSFSWLKVLSPLELIGCCEPMLRSRTELNDYASEKFARKRGPLVDAYILVWLGLESLFLFVVAYKQYPNPARALLVLLVSLRVIEIVQVTVNLTIFDPISGRPDQLLGSQVRAFVLAAVNYIELILCSGKLLSYEHGKRVTR